MTERIRGEVATRFAHNVRARRELLELSQTELGQRMQDLGFRTFRQQVVAEIEAGARAIKLDEAIGLARALGSNLDALARPAGLTAEASELVAAAAEAREAYRQTDHWLGELEQARLRLEKAIAKAKRHADELADEMSIAHSALDETGE